jgi:hypothetical protein
MNKSDEDKQAEWRERHAREFCLLNGISQAEWDLAQEMTDDLVANLFVNFWKIWERDHDVSSADNSRPAKRRAPRHSKRRSGTG